MGLTISLYREVSRNTYVNTNNNNTLSFIQEIVSICERRDALTAWSKFVQKKQHEKEKK